MNNVRQITEFSAQVKNEIVEILTIAFARNNMVYMHFFKGSTKKRHTFMLLCADYYIKFGIIYGCYNGDGKLVAVSLWNEPNTKSLSVGNIIKGGLFFKFIKSVCKIGLPSFNRITKSAAQLNEFHIKQPHYYLFMLASAEKSAGSFLMQSNIGELSPKAILYWESSVEKDNHAFYKAFGAQSIGEKIIGNTSNMFFVMPKKD